MYLYKFTNTNLLNVQLRQLGHAVVSPDKRGKYNTTVHTDTCTLRYTGYLHDAGQCNVTCTIVAAK
jgi:hypothetical protein